MIKTFKEYLAESIPRTIMSIDVLVDTLNQHCKDSTWMVKNDPDTYPLYRGSNSGASVLSTEKFAIMTATDLTSRMPSTGYTYYSNIFDALFKKFHTNIPPRRSSIFATSRFSRAKSYGDVSCLIPFNDAVIGVVHRVDMWDIKFDVLGVKRFGPLVFDSLLSKIDMPDNLDGIRKFSENLKNDKETEVKQYQELSKLIKSEYTGFSPDSSDAKKWKNDFYNQLISQFKTEINTNMKSVSPKDLKQYMSSEYELWVYGKMVNILPEVLEQLSIDHNANWAIKT